MDIRPTPRQLERVADLTTPMVAAIFVTIAASMIWFLAEFAISVENLLSAARVVALVVLIVAMLAMVGVSRSAVPRWIAGLTFVFAGCMAVRLWIALSGPADWMTSYTVYWAVTGGLVVTSLGPMTIACALWVAVGRGSSRAHHLWIAWLVLFVGEAWRDWFVWLDMTARDHGGSLWTIPLILAVGAAHLALCVVTAVAIMRLRDDILAFLLRELRTA